MEQTVKRLDLTGWVCILYRIYWRISLKLHVLRHKILEYKISVEILQAYKFYKKSASKNCCFLSRKWNISLKFAGRLGVGVYGVRISVKEGCSVIR